MLLQSGDKGIKVANMQNKLLAKGFVLPVYGADGDYGPETARAVTAFQLANKLSPTGMADNKTYNLIMGIVDVTPSSSLVSTLTAYKPPMQSSQASALAKPSFMTNLMSMRATPTNIAILAAIGGIAFLYFNKKRRRV